MDEKKPAELKVVFDPLESSALIVMGKKKATVPFPVHSQSEAESMGEAFALNLGWIDRHEPSD